LFRRTNIQLVSSDNAPSVIAPAKREQATVCDGAPRPGTDGSFCEASIERATGPKDAAAFEPKVPLASPEPQLRTAKRLVARLTAAASFGPVQRQQPPPSPVASPEEPVAQSTQAPASATYRQDNWNSTSHDGRSTISTMRAAWRRSLPGLLVIILLTIFINILKLTVPLYIFQMLDRVIASRSFDTLIMLTIMAGFAFLTASLAEMLRRVMLIHWSMWIKTQFGKSLFAGSFNGARDRPPSKSIDDLKEVSEFASSSGLTAWLDAIWAPAFLLLVYVIHPLLALIVLGGMISMLLLGVLNETVTRPLRSAARQAKQKSEGLLAAAETNRETVAGLNVAPRLAARWDASAALQASENSASRLAGLSISETMRFIEGIQRIACYAVGVWLTIEGSMTAGGVIAGAVLGRLGTSAVRKGMSSWRPLTVAWRAHQRIADKLKSMSEPRAAIRDRKQPLALNIERVTHSYNSKMAPVITELELSIRPGESLVVIGPSGSGKSTLARLIAGTLEPTAGRILLGELDVSRFTTDERQRLIGYLQQDTHMLPGTISENISALREADPQDIVEAAKLAGIHDVIMRLPKGYETQLSGQSIPLSGGEIRRLGLARALFGQPHVIILDEPEANLDEGLVAHMLEALSICRASGALLVVTSQSADFAAIADKVLVLDCGGQAQLLDSGQDLVADWYRENHLSKRFALFARPAPPNETGDS